MPLFVSNEEFVVLAADPAALAAKADEKISAMVVEIETLKARSDAATISAEQTCAALERRYIALEKDRAVIEADRQSLRKSLANTTSELATVKSRVHSLQLAIVEKDGEIERRGVEIRELHSSKRSVLDLLEEKNVEIRGKNEAIKNYLDKIESITKERTTAVGQHREEQRLRGLAQAAQARLEQEKLLLERHNTWLSNELNSKAEAMLEQQRASSQKAEELAAKLEKSEGARAQAEKALQVANRQLASLEASLEEAQKNFKEISDTAVAQEAHFEEELRTAARLGELYQERVKERDAKCTELEGVLATLKQHLTGLLDEAEATLNREKEKSAKLHKELEELRAELQRYTAKQLPPSSPRGDGGESSLALVPALPAGRTVGEPQRRSIMELSPSAAAISLLPEGTTLTALYSRYAEVEDALRHEQAARRRVQSYLDQILQELEEKAPLIQEQRQEYERLAESHALLLGRLKDADAQLQASGKAISAAQAEREQARDEARRLRTQWQDASHQVRQLLDELQRLKQGGHGGNDRDPARVLARDGGENAIVTADDVITERLVSFRDISELQERNAQLLALTRQLGEEAERELAKAKSEYDASLQSGLGQVMAELETMRDQRERQEKLFAAVVRQRDMYRSLLGSSDNEAARRAAGLGTATGDRPGGTSEGVGGAGGGAPIVDYLRLYEDAQKELATFKEQAAENSRMAKQDTDKLRDELSQARADKSRADHALAFERERLTRLEQALADKRAEVDHLARRNAEFAASLTAHQSQLREASQGAAAAQEALRRKSMEAATLEAEKSLLAAAEERARTTAESLSVENNRLQASLDAQQEVQQARQDEASRERLRLVTEVQRLQTEWAAAKKEAEAERERASAAVTAGAERTALVQSKADEAAAMLANAREQLAEREKRLAAAEARVTTLEASLAKAEDKLQLVLAGGSADGGAAGEAGASSGGKGVSNEAALAAEIVRLKDDLSTAQEDAAALRRHVDQYKSIAEANEEALKQMGAAHNTFKAESEKSLAAAEAEIRTLSERLASAERLAADKAAADAAAIRESEAVIARVQKEHRAAMAELEGQRQRLAEAEQREAALKKDVEEYHRLWREAKVSYEREVLHLAEHIRNFAEANEARASAEKAAAELRDTLEGLKADKISATKSWEAEAEALRSKEQAAHQRAAELDEQNRILHNQLAAMASRAAAAASLGAGAGVPELAAAATGEGAGADGSAGGEGAGKEGSLSLESPDVQEVIRFLRHERDTLACKLALAEHEQQRLAAKAAHAQRAADEAKAQAQALAQQSHARLQAEQEHQALLAQVEQLNLLRESNATLRDENERNLRAAKEARDKAAAAEQATQPLLQQIRELRAAAEAEALDREMLKGERDRWQKRAEQLTSKYEAVNLEEFKAVQEELARTKEELKLAQASLGSLKKELEAARVSLDKAQRELEEARSKVDLKEESLVVLRAQVAKLRNEGRGGAATQQALQAAVAKAKLEAEAAAAQAEAKLEQLQKEVTEERERVEEERKKEGLLKKKAMTLFRKVQEERNRLQGEKEGLAKENEELATRVREAQAAEAEAKGRLAAMMSKPPAAAAPPPVPPQKGVDVATVTAAAAAAAATAAAAAAPAAPPVVPLAAANAPAAGAPARPASRGEAGAAAAVAATPSSPALADAEAGGEGQPMEPPAAATSAPTPPPPSKGPGATETEAVAPPATSTAPSLGSGLRRVVKPISGAAGAGAPMTPADKLAAAARAKEEEIMRLREQMQHQEQSRPFGRQMKVVGAGQRATPTPGAAAAATPAPGPGAAGAASAPVQPAKAGPVRNLLAISRGGAAAATAGPTPAAARPLAAAAGPASVGGMASGMAGGAAPVKIEATGEAAAGPPSAKRARPDTGVTAGSEEGAPVLPQLVTAKMGEGESAGAILSTSYRTELACVQASGGADASGMQQLRPLSLAPAPVMGAQAPTDAQEGEEGTKRSAEGEPAGGEAPPVKRSRVTGAEDDEESSRQRAEAELMAAEEAPGTPLIGGTEDSMDVAARAVASPEPEGGTEAAEGYAGAPPAAQETEGGGREEAMEEEERGAVGEPSAEEPEMLAGEEGLEVATYEGQEEGGTDTEPEEGERFADGAGDMTEGAEAEGGQEGGEEGAEAGDEAGGMGEGEDHGLTFEGGDLGDGFEGEQMGGQPQPGQEPLGDDPGAHLEEGMEGQEGEGEGATGQPELDHEEENALNAVTEGSFEIIADVIGGGDGGGGGMELGGFLGWDASAVGGDQGGDQGGGEEVGDRGGGEGKEEQPPLTQAPASGDTLADARARERSPPPSQPGPQGSPLPPAASASGSDGPAATRQGTPPVSTTASAAAAAALRGTGRGGSGGRVISLSSIRQSSPAEALTGGGRGARARGGLRGRGGGLGRGGGMTGDGRGGSSGGPADSQGDETAK
eukprot:jgi/Mesvir1/6021/Mv00765-RA.1